ncbi:hypothetical protein E3N88_00532 [Mikania micrantha]|uniref:Uncharacterized protein n=1 Tax=Mikania micrantha TaxID=192012 RepID=A0A5N6Q023_9ASTR|nr:hypothetical protein E3N88_00532 [Mikania micrantha]
MEFITPVVTAIVDSLMVPIKKHLGFFFSSKKHVANMTKKLSKLNEVKHDMEKKREDALINDRLTPDSLSRWLEKVETITRKTENISIHGNGCLNIKIIYKAGKSSFDILQEIEDLLEEKNIIEWSNKQRPLGMVISSIGPSTSQIDYDVTQYIFQSRKSIFNNILTSLEHDNNDQRMALWGMGGMGKTTMMEDVKKVVEKRGMFAYVLKLDIGRKYDPITTQKHIANHMGVSLIEETREDRVERLGKSFEEMSKMGKKILLILDDVWEVIDLKDIGLGNPFPKGFKLLVTSRNKKVCIGMNIEPHTVFEVGRLEEEEARHFFWKTLGNNDAYGEFRIIGEDIVNKCRGLPIAIKTIALALRCEEKDAWEVAHENLRRHNLKDIEDLEYIVYNIFEISYEYLKKEDDKSIFILCGLFPDDFDITLEELLKFGWGLQFFKKADSLAEARKRINMSINNLISANLLTKSDTAGCVKMHDLARDFVLNDISKFKQASIINHGGMSEWPTHDSCERILLTCKGMTEFPKDFYYPNLSLLKLMNGHKLLNLPENFHKRMEKLEVMAYDEMWYPLCARSLCYSTNLRTLCLHSCSLVDNDISFLGSLVTLEVLSLAQCGINRLPSTIKKLKMLKFLDLNGCFELCIDDDVFQSLDKLEELHMRVSESKSIRFSNANCDELKLISGKLNALEVEFFENILQPKNVTFKNLQRFRISMGCFLNNNHYLYRIDKHSFKNTLMLVTNCNDLLECKINELFSRTEELHLSVKDITYVEEISLSPTQPSTFSNLKVFHVFKCEELTHLFTIPIANGLKKLESLIVATCPLLKSIACSCDNVNVMELPRLTGLTLYDLPNFTSIILDNDTVATQPSLLNKEVLIPNLSKLMINGLKNLKQIWACDFSGDEEDNVSMLKVIKVKDCNSLVNLFPCNPMRLLTHLEELEVNSCCSIEVIFNIDLGKIKQHIISNLRSIQVSELDELREVWRINEENNSSHLIRGFQAIENIRIRRCKKFRNIFTPISATFDMRAVVDISILANKVDEAEINGISKVDDDMSITAFPSYHLTRAFNHIHRIEFVNVEGTEVLFEIETPSINKELVTTHQKQSLPLLPRLEDLKLENIHSMSYVWKYNNWSEFFILHKNQPQSSFQNLTNIYLFKCNGLKYLFSPLMSKLLFSLKKLEILYCETMEEVVSSRDYDDEVSNTSTRTLFPCLDDLRLGGLYNMKQIGGGVAKCSRMGVVPWFLCQYPTRIHILECPSLSTLIPTMVEAFESKDIGSSSTSNIGQGSISFPRPKTITNLSHQLTNLKILRIFDCPLLEYIFTFSTLESLKKLEELGISNCKAMKVIVSEDHGEESSSKVVFPRLKSIQLVDLPKLAGFFVGIDINFEWKSLDHVKIIKCPQMMMFTSESVCLGTQETPWSFCNLIEMNSLTNQENEIVPSNELLQLQILEKIDLSDGSIVELFEVKNNESQTIVKFPKLREVGIYYLEDLKYMWKSNQWTIFEFPKLTKLTIGFCKSLEHVFTASMVGSLVKLQEIHLQECEHMEVIVKKEKEESDDKVDEIMFPCLKSLKLVDLASLKGFFLGKCDFFFPSMNSLMIKKCPEIRIFSEGRAIVPELKLVETSFGFFQAREDISSFVTSKVQEASIYY